MMVSVRNALRDPTTKRGAVYVILLGAIGSIIATGIVATFLSIDDRFGFGIKVGFLMVITPIYGST